MLKPIHMAKRPEETGKNVHNSDIREAAQGMPASSSSALPQWLDLWAGSGPACITTIEQHPAHRRRSARVRSCGRPVLCSVWVGKLEGRHAHLYCLKRSHFWLINGLALVTARVFLTLSHTHTHTKVRLQ